MPTGTLKMWNADRGFGFIGDDAGGPDVFLHVSALQSAGIDPDDIRKGERLTLTLKAAVKERPMLATFAGRAEGDDGATIEKASLVLCGRSPLT